MIHRARKQLLEARVAFLRYIELAPNAADASMIKGYLEEIRP